MVIGMQGVAKAVLVAIIVSICFLLFVNFAFFFPWYSTLVIETFNLSQIAAKDNYVKETYYQTALANLQSRPIFKDKSDEIEIIIRNSDDRDAVGFDDETLYQDESYAEWDKPYKQRGEPITVTIRAVYPFTVTLWGKKYERELPVEFSLQTVGLKHYKDLEYYD